MQLAGSPLVLTYAALAAPLAGALLWRGVGRRLHPSRTLAFRLISIAAIVCYLAAVAGIASAFEPSRTRDASWPYLAAIVALAAAAILLVNPANPWRARIKLLIARHLFRHRYDYRTEWLRFAETVGRDGDGAPPLEQRVVRAIAQLPGATGGLLLALDERGALRPGAVWQWNHIDPPAVAGSLDLVRALEQSGSIVDLDAARRGEGPRLPDWLLATGDAWALVPLPHGGRLIGAVALRRAVIDRRLDWEDFDLLRVAGRQVASYLAEARGQEALSEARRFDEFNRRFAFILHDIKNLVSQLSLVARNAERHADNPDFRADMIATLHESTAKMNDLLARLSQHQRAAPEDPRPVALGSIAEAVAAAKRRAHPIHLDADDTVALADPGRLEQALTHLVQNAIDASPAGSGVWIRTCRRGIEAVVEVLDHGRGMSAEFMRTRLFKPFASTKEGGFGIGAHEARALVTGMGGRLEVESREGEGSRFIIVLPLAGHEADPAARLARVA